MLIDAPRSCHQSARWQDPTDIVINQPRGKEIHVIADNLSAHKSGPVKDFLAAHPKVHLHFTPTCSSWPNQIRRTPHILAGVQDR